MKPRIGAALLIVLWTGCTIGPDYERPVVPEPETFRSESEEAIDMNSLADMPWWDLFQDEELQNLIRIALKENKDLRLAVARIDEARAEVGVTRSVFFPQLEGDTSYTRAGINAVSIPGEDGTTDITTDIYRIGGSLSWEIDIWGQLRRATEAARAELLASEEARRAIIIRLISGVAQSYFELRALDLEIEITRKTGESRRALSRIVTARHEDGLVSGLDKVRAEAEVVKILAEIPDLERQIVQQENALSILLGRNPDSIPRGGELVNQTIPPIIPAGLPSSLLERRPDRSRSFQHGN